TVSLAGDVAAGQTVDVDVSSSAAYVIAQAPVTNAGTIRLGSGSAAQSAALDVRGSGLTNAGRLEIAAPAGAARRLQGTIVNTGTVDVEADTSWSGPVGAG